MVKLFQKIKFKSCLMKTWGNSLAWGQVNSLAKRFAWRDWGRKKLYMVLSHSYYIYATWKSNDVGMREVLRPSYGWGTNFCGMSLTPLDIMLTIFRLVIALLLTDDVNYYIHPRPYTYTCQFQTLFRTSFEKLQTFF